MKKNEEIKYSIRLIIIIGFVLSIAMGFLDIAASVLSGPSGFSAFSFILPPLVATISAFFLIYLISWFPIVHHLGRLLKLDTVPLAISLALFLGVLFTLIRIDNLFQSSLSLTDLFKVSVHFSFSLLISIVTYLIAKAVGDMSSYKNIAVVFSFAIPFILAETVVFVWLHIYRIDRIISIPSLLVSAGYILIILFTMGLFYRVVHKIKMVSMLSLCISFIVVSLLVTLIATKGPHASLDGFNVSDHPVNHVILITVDTLRADVLSSYNKLGVSTPRIDQLATDGILFTKAISASPWTLPSLSTILTGLSPSVHLVTETESKISDNVTTLAEHMRDAGYFTAAFVNNDYLRPTANLSQGFLEYNFLQNPSFGNSVGMRFLQWLFPRQFPSPPWPTTGDHTQLAVNWLKTNYTKDFFLWIHYYDPHAPFAPPPEYYPKKEPPPGIGMKFTKQREVISGTYVPSLNERAWIKDLYDSEVSYVNENIGKLIDALKELNLYNESLIVFTSDHGEEFWEHGRHGHGHSLYNELLWVPLIIKLPLSDPKGAINEAVETQSVMPTILDLSGIEYKGDYLSSGSLTPLWGPDPDLDDRKPIVSTAQVLFDRQESVIFNGFKYIHSLLSNHEELYVLTRDPGEHISVIYSSPDKVQIARNILKERHEKDEQLRTYYLITEKEEVKFDTEERRRLKALGYVQ